MDLWFFFLMHLIWALDLECVPCLIRESTKGKSLLAVYGQLSANPLWSKGRNHIKSCTSLHILSLISPLPTHGHCHCGQFQIPVVSSSMSLGGVAVKNRASACRDCTFSCVLFKTRRPYAVEVEKKVNSWQKPRGLIGPVLIPGFCSASGRVETTPRIGH